MKLEKFIKFLKIFIVALVLILIVVIAVVLVKDDKQVEEPIEIHDCIKLGEYCSEQQVYDGVEVEVALNDNQKERFYVISNTSTTMTLMMKKNIVRQIDWFDNILNISGPELAMRKLVGQTKEWKNVDIIEDFQYQDGGRLAYEENCKTNPSDAIYDCASIQAATKGYISASIINGQLTIVSNFEGRTQAGNQAKNVRARLITLEEINALTYKNKLPNWLISNLKKNEGYWTMTSATGFKTSYSQGAIAIANVDRKPSIESLKVQKKYEEDYTIGIRPVITIDKISENKTDH